MTEITIGVALEAAIARLSAVGVDNPRMDARLLLCHSACLELANIIVDPNVVLADECFRKFETLVERREKREPVSHLIGEREFWSLPFIVTADVLDPRPASETLIEAALDHVRDRSEPVSVLDLGTGSGCLLIAVLSELPGARGVGVDTSEAALVIARRNAEKNLVDDCTTFVSSSWGRSVSGSFDLILSNPPYISESERDDLEPEVAMYEPASALFAGKDGLSAYREVAPDILRLLNPDGVAAIECGRDQMTTVIEIFDDAGLRHVETRCDLDGIERSGVFCR
ncbi:MAG: peptide chain release factor N(5)-glutamine methyltransferase [Alphaproteobacteria bacterium]